MSPTSLVVLEVCWGIAERVEVIRRKMEIGNVEDVREEERSPAGGLGGFVTHASPNGASTICTGSEGHSHLLSMLRQDRL